MTKTAIRQLTRDAHNRAIEQAKENVRKAACQQSMRRVHRDKVIEAVYGKTVTGRFLNGAELVEDKELAEFR